MASNPYDDLVEANPYDGMADGGGDSATLSLLKRMGIGRSIGKPMTPEQKKAAADVMNRGWGTGIPKFANDVGGFVTDKLAGILPPEMAALGGYLGNVGTQAVPALMSGFRKVDAPTASLGEKPASWLMQSVVKPGQDDRLSGAADKAIKTMLDEGISGTRGGMDKAGNLVNKIHGQVETAVANSPAEVPLGPIGQKYLSQYEKALTQANPEADLGAVRDVWGQFVKSPLVGGQDSIPVPLAHLIKRGTQQAVGSKAYGEMGSSSTEAQKSIARYLREGVADAVPEVVAPLKREAALMNVLDVARNRALLNANSNPLSLGSLRIGDNPLSTAAFLADKSALLKSLAARGLYQGGRPEYLMPGILAGQDIRGMLSER